MHTSLQAGIAATYGIIVGAPVYLFDTATMVIVRRNDDTMRYWAGRRPGVPEMNLPFPTGLAISHGKSLPSHLHHGGISSLQRPRPQDSRKRRRQPSTVSARHFRRRSRSEVIRTAEPPTGSSAGSK